MLSYPPICSGIGQEICAAALLKQKSFKYNIIVVTCRQACDNFYLSPGTETAAKTAGGVLCIKGRKTSGCFLIVSCSNRKLWMFPLTTAQHVQTWWLDEGGLQGVIMLGRVRV